MSQATLRNVQPTEDGRLCVDAVIETDDGMTRSGVHYLELSADATPESIQAALLALYA